MNCLMPKTSIASIRRLEILEHYYSLIREEGLEGASIVKLARRMEIPSSLVIHYFKTKDELIQALITYQLEQYEQQFRPRLQMLAPEDRLSAVLAALFSQEWMELADVQVFYSCYPLIFRNTAVRIRFQELFARFHTHLTSELALAKTIGLIQVENISIASHMLIVWVEGFNFYANIHQQESLFRQISTELYAQACTYLGFFPTKE
ncbi:MAG: TetR family transcriptional regulator [Bacteroidia bacterium]|nr:TetR family transcriptional regulator [Bacteroidia bacterium]